MGGVSRTRYRGAVRKKEKLLLLKAGKVMRPKGQGRGDARQAYVRGKGRDLKSRRRCEKKGEDKG